MRAALVTIVLTLLPAFACGKERPPEPPSTVLEYAIDTAPGAEPVAARQRTLAIARRRLRTRSDVTIDETPAGLRVTVRSERAVAGNEVAALVERRAPAAMSWVDPATPAIARLAELATAEPGAGITVEDERWDGPGQTRFGGPVLGALDRATLETWLADAQRRHPETVLPADRRVAFQRLITVHEGARPSVRWRVLVLEQPPLLTGASFARVTPVSDLPTGEPRARIELDEDGARRLREGTSANVGGKLGIEFGDLIRDTWVVQAPWTDGIVDVSGLPGHPGEILLDLEGNMMAPLRLVSRRDPPTATW